MFDPKAPFGTIHGQCAEFPGAAFSQNGKVYDVHKKEIGGTGEVATASSTPPPPPPPPTDDVAEVAEKLRQARTLLAADPSPSRKAAVTKLEKKLAALTSE
jgi:hypothetical protein